MGKGNKGNKGNSKPKSKSKAKNARTIRRAQRRQATEQTASMASSTDIVTPQYEANTELFSAIARNNVSQVKEVLTQIPAAHINLARDTPFSIKRNRYYEPGFTPLFASLHTGNVEIIKLLLEAGADTNITMTQFNVVNITAIGYMITLPLPTEYEHNRIAILQLLVEHGADINWKFQVQMSDLKAHVPAVVLAMYQYNDELVEFFLSQDSLDYTLIFELNDCTLNLLNFIIDHSVVDLLAPNQKKLCLKWFKAIVEKSPNLNQVVPHKDNTSLTALMIAVKLGNAIAFHYLLRQPGIDLSTEGQLHGHCVNIMTLVIHIIGSAQEEADRVSCMSYFNELINRKAHLIPVSSNTPLLMAVMISSYDLVETLLRHGASVAEQCKSDMLIVDEPTKLQNLVDRCELKIELEANCSRDTLGLLSTESMSVEKMHEFNQQLLDKVKADDEASKLRKISVIDVAITTDNSILLSVLLKYHKNLGDIVSSQSVYNENLKCSEDVDVSYFLLACIGGKESLATMMFEAGANPLYSTVNSIKKRITPIGACIENQCKNLWPRILSHVISDETPKEIQVRHIQAAFVAIVNHGNVQQLDLIIEHIDHSKPISDDEILRLDSCEIAKGTDSIAAVKQNSDIEAIPIPPTHYICHSEQYIKSYYYLRDKGWDFKQTYNYGADSVPKQRGIWENLAKPLPKEMVIAGLPPLCMALLSRLKQNRLMVKVLIQDGADPFQKHSGLNWQENSAIDMCCITNRIDQVDLLCNNTQLLEYARSPHSPIFTFALIYQRNALLMKLIQAGYKASLNVNANGQEQYTYLDFYLCLRENFVLDYDVLAMLVETVDAEYLNSHSRVMNTFTMLQLVLLLGDPKSIRIALSKKPKLDLPINVNELWFDANVWHMAFLLIEPKPHIIAELARHVFQLPDAGADAVATGAPVSMVAVEYNNIELLSRLIMLGMRYNIPHEMDPYDGHTALSYAISLGRFDMVYMMMTPTTDIQQIIAGQTIHKQLTKIFTDKQCQQILAKRDWQTDKLHSVRNEPFLVRKPKRQKHKVRDAISNRINLTFLENNAEYWYIHANSHMKALLTQKYSDGQSPLFDRRLRHNLLRCLESIRKLYEHLSIPKTQTYSLICQLRNVIRHYAKIHMPDEFTDDHKTIIPVLENLLKQFKILLSPRKSLSNTAVIKSVELPAGLKDKMDQWIKKPYWTISISKNDMIEQFIVLKALFKNIPHRMFVPILTDIMADIKLLILDIHESNKTLGLIQGDLAQQIRQLSNCIAHDLCAEKATDTTFAEVSPYDLFHIAKQLCVISLDSMCEKTMTISVG